ncbi:MAG: signal peptidase II [Vicinamibacterales bacterium]
MSDAAALDGRRPRRLELWIPLAVIITDQCAKYLIRRSLAVHESIPVLPGFLDFTHVRNTGAAFGMLDDLNFPFKTAIVGVVAASALVAVTLYSRTLSHGQLLARIGLALIVGGAAGNLVDRLTVGSVVDFVDVYWRNWHFWVFNVADSAISIGVTVMIFDMLWTSTHVSTTV